MANKVGRPPFEITDEVLADAERMASLGLTQEQIAHNLGISITTLCDKKVKFAEFSAAIKRGKALGLDKVANALFNNATESNNTSAQIFYLKARGGWNDNNNTDAAANKELVQD